VDPSLAGPAASDRAAPRQDLPPAPTPYAPATSLSGPATSLSGPVPGYNPTQLSGPRSAGGPPTPFLPAAPVRPRSGRRPVLTGVAAVLLAGLIAGGVLLATRGSPSAHATGTHSTAQTTQAPTSQAASSSAASSPPAAGPGPTIPAGFAGTWTGTTQMTGGGTAEPPHQITFTLRAGGRTAAETEAGGSCVNTLTLTAATASVLTFDEPGNAACAAGTTTFTRHGRNLAYRWVDTTGLVQQVSTLHRS